LLGAIWYIISTLIGLLQLIIIVQAVLSWLVAFDVINRQNNVVQSVGRFTYAVTEPILKPFRALIPPIGGVDITPILALIALEALKIIIQWALFDLMR
jgi:YggT family protein